MTLKKRISIGELERQGAIVGIQDGNHGEKHPVAADYVSHGIPFIMARDIRNGRVDLTHCKFLPKEQADTLRIGFARSGDVLLTHKGTVGSVAIVPNVDDYVMLTPQVTYYRVDSEHLDNRYLQYAFEEPGFQSQLHSHSAQSTRSYIGITAQRQLEICYRPIVEQRQIAGILSAYDDLIENNTRRIKILEEMAQALYREWFVHFRFPGHEHVPLVDSPAGPIPEGWEVEELGNIAQDSRRTVQPDELDPETPYVGLEHIPRRSIALSEWGQSCDVQSTKLSFYKGEILFGKIRPYFHKVAVAPVDGVCSTDAIVISARTHEYYPLVLACVSSTEFVDHATQTSQGTKMPRANWDVLIKYLVPIPPPSLLDQFNSNIQTITSKLMNLVFRNANLRVTRDLLLPALISGEVDVSTGIRQVQHETVQVV